jgi:hypothetical protein
MAIVEKYEGEVKSIKASILKMCWYMRGGITYEEAMAMSVNERNLINSIIEGNIETTKKSGLPFF